MAGGSEPLNISLAGGETTQGEKCTGLHVISFSFQITCLTGKKSDPRSQKT